MQILQRYLLRTMVINFIGVTLVLFAILFVNQVGTVLARAAQLQYQSRFVLELIGLGAAQNVALLLPIGLILGIVLAFGQHYHDSEMAAAQACGIGVRRIARPVWLLALPVAALVAWLNFDLPPRAAAAEAALRSEALRAGMLAPLKPGAFRSFSGGQIVVYARGSNPQGDLLDVFVKRSIGEALEVTVAQRAHYSMGADGSSETITLYDGERTEGVPGTRRYRIMRFAEQAIPVRTPTVAANTSRVDTRRTADLVFSREPKLQAEWQWRLGLPLMTLVLTGLAVPLSRLRPRQGRYARVWLAILLFALYAMLALATRTWMVRGVVPLRVGLWWVHAVFLVLVVLAYVTPHAWRHWRAGLYARRLA